MNLTIDTLQTAGFVPALKALHLPMGKPALVEEFYETSEWHEYQDGHEYHVEGGFVVPKHDLALVKRLVLNGDAHAKVLRGCMVYFELTAPRYFWQEMNTYRVGCECLSSESTMHTILRDGVLKENKPTEQDGISDKEWEHIDADCAWIDELRKYYAKADTDSEKTYLFNAIKRSIPEWFKQKRVLMVSYQTLRRIYFQRRHHRLQEWRQFCEWIKTLPFAEELITCERSRSDENNS